MPCLEILHVKLISINSDWIRCFMPPSSFMPIYWQKEFHIFFTLAAKVFLLPHKT